MKKLNKTIRIFYRNKTNWTKDEVMTYLIQEKILIKLIRKFGKKDWKRISNVMKNKSPIQCFSKWQRLRKYRKLNKNKRRNEIIISDYGLYLNLYQG